MPEWAYLRLMCGGQLVDHEPVHNYSIFIPSLEKSSSHYEHRFPLRCPIPIGEEARTRASQSAIRPFGGPVRNVRHLGDCQILLLPARERKSSLRPK